MTQGLLQRLKAWLPSPETIRSQRWLRWLAPFMSHPRLWHLSRKGVAMGVALGVFFGLLIPIAQMPAAGVAAVLLRANLPAAMASTFVTNPVTFGPVYYAAYRLGKGVLGEDPLPNGQAPDEERLVEELTATPEEEPASLSLVERFQRWLVQISRVGKPLFTGLVILAIGCGLAVYVLTDTLWRLRVRRTRRRRLARRMPTSPAPADGKDGGAGGN